MSQQLFEHGKVYSMKTKAPAQALLARDGVIVAVGTPEEVEACVQGPAERIDLQGGALLPAFLDAHSHLSGYAASLLHANLSRAADFDGIVSALRDFIKQRGIPAGQWVQADGYDHTALREKRHPTRELLDAALPEHPVALQHASGHFGVFNTPALRQLGLLDAAPDGFLQESAYMEAAQKIPMPDFETLCAAFQQAQQRYASFGIATVQEGMMPDALAPLYAALRDRNALWLDVVGYADLRGAGECLRRFGAKRGYEGHFRLGGYKMFLDGSPQGRTAWMRTPYATQEGWFGEPERTDAEVLACCRRAAAESRQLLVHCNGDAAAQQLLDAWKIVCAENPRARAMRTVMIHAQLLDRDQLPLVKQYGILPSFFVAHVYHWGDIHRENFGELRAQRISPAASALREGICFTFHQDAPVLEPDMLETIWCAASRTTRSGIVLGPEERISVYEALRAVTANAAYQYFEESSKGTLAPGMRADLVWLEQDPMTTALSEVRAIRVKGTWKDGKSVYAAH